MEAHPRIHRAGFFEQYIERGTSVLTGRASLEPLKTFREFPVYMGCTDAPREADLFADLSFAICRDTGVIQLDRLLPLEIVYQFPHNDGVGQAWARHYEALASFVERDRPKRILEIGGGAGEVAH